MAQEEKEEISFNTEMFQRMFLEEKKLAFKISDGDLDDQKVKDVSENKKYYVYILESSDCKATYVGATVDLNHRLRQHNKELAGGAHATSVKVAQGCTWNRICHVQGFPDWPAALQFEWRLKQLSRKLLKITSVPSLSPIQRRIQALHQLLSLEKPTTKAIPYSSWPSPPEIIWETCETNK